MKSPLSNKKKLYEHNYNIALRKYNYCDTNKFIIMDFSISPSV